LTFFHSFLFLLFDSCFLFKNLSKKYFNNKVFSLFRIKNSFKGNYGKEINMNTTSGHIVDLILYLET